MTTARSPKRKLKAQAKQCAAMVKMAERGDPKMHDPYGSVAKARAEKDSFVFTIAMDDKFLKIEMTWKLISETEEKALAQYIHDQMRETRATVH